MKKSREKQQPSRIREGCFVCGGVIVFFRYVRPAPLGSLGQRELAAVRLTEGLTRPNSHRSRYLQPLRQKSSILPPPLTQGRHRRTAMYHSIQGGPCLLGLPRGSGISETADIRRAAGTRSPASAVKSPPLRGGAMHAIMAADFFGRCGHGHTETIADGAAAA